MKKKKVIIISSIIAVILIAIAVIVAVTMLSNKDEKDNKESLEWGDVYLEVLNDKKKLEDMDNQKIQLCDLDKDSIPELIIYGIKNAKDYIANIYKINDKNEVDTVKVSLSEEFDLQLLYNIEEDDYTWYAVTASNTEDKKVYDLNIENKKYEPQLLDLKYETGFVPVEENHSEKVAFNKEASKSEKKEIFNQAKEKYIKTEDMITDEIKEKVEIAKSIKKIEKIDASKEIVYSVNEIQSRYVKATYPAINIKSSDVQKINSEIEKEYGFKTEQDLMEMSAGELEEMGYEYYINGKILSLFIYQGGNNSTWPKTYNIDLTTQKQMTASEVLKEKGLNETEVNTKAQEAVNKKFEEVIERDKSALGNNWAQMYTQGKDSTIEWKNEITEKLKTLDNSIYINKVGDVCVATTVQHAGGQWSCWLTIIVNITDNYSVKDFETTTIKNYMTPTTAQTTPSNTTPSSSSTTTEETTSNSEEPTEKNAIGKEKAQKLAESVWGTTSSETGFEIGYSYAGWGKESSGKQYYIFNARWFNGTNWSYMGTICISADGKTYKQLDTVVNPTVKGDTFTMTDGGTF